MHDVRIAQEAARSAVSSFAANQQGNQPTPSYQSGFVPYSSAAHNAAVQPRAGQEGKTFKRAIFTFSRLVYNFTNEHQRMVKKNSEDLLKWVACKFLCQEQCSKGSPNKWTKTTMPCVPLSSVRKCWCKGQISWLKLPLRRWLLLRVLLPVHPILKLSRWDFQLRDYRGLEVI